MGVLPLQFKLDQNRKSLNLNGSETLDIFGLTGVELTPRMNLTLAITREDGSSEKIEVLCRIDTLNEVEYFKSGGILHYVLRQLIAS
ncbi:Aconitate hydratase precursor [compost metagenome]